MKRIRRLLPVIGVTGAIILLSCTLYFQMMEYEKNECWQALESSAQSVNKEISMKFKDEIMKLNVLGSITLVQEQIEEQLKFVHLDMVQPTTIFSRIDVFYPDGSVLLNGTEWTTNPDIDFNKAAAKGEHISERMVDRVTGTECVYYMVPVMDEGEKCAILVGVIESKRLAEIFYPTIYNGEANCCLIDINDGNFIMDSWHEELGNAYSPEMLERKRVKGYEDVDLETITRNKGTTVVAFESRTTGSNLYMYSTPLDMFDWQLVLFVQEPVVFESLFHFRALLLHAGIAEALLLVLYFLWNIRTVNQLEKSNTEIVQQQEELKYVSYTDLLTEMHNRNKYIELLDACKEQTLAEIGVVYLDLNGLKQINDTQSHKAGDQYIRKAARVCNRVFPNNCYRIGGDEFVVIAREIERTQFIDCIEQLEELIKKEKVSISMGFLWETACTDLEELLKKAEEQMYQEKNRFYQAHERWR